jgi:asparagine synthase (glutamine-hydrolysing)
MCGIGGILKVKEAISVQELAKLSEILAHRGPDGEGLWINEKKTIGFIHRRLSIIDLSNEARQPMQSFDKRFIITFNGEIYNYIELRTILINKGYKFYTQSDTEVLLNLYHCFGYECLKMLDGMFSFAIWDTQTEQLFIARDRFGEKPLYYTSSNSTFAFASEIKAIFSLGILREPNTDSWFNFLANGNIHNAENPSSTFYKNIFQLKNAHYIVVDNTGKIKEEVQYWNLGNICLDRNISFPDACEQFHNLFDESISLRLRSDVPVGSSLSGGLDSSSIVLTANKFISSADIQSTFSARFNDFALDEGLYIDYVTKCKANIKKFEVFPSPNNFLTDFDNLCYHQDEPFTSASVYAQYAVMRLAKEHNITVLLDGQGADEQLGGYMHYYHYKLTNLFLNSNLRFFTEKKEFNKLHSTKDQYTLPNRIIFWKFLKTLKINSVPYEKNLKEVLKQDSENGLLQSLLRYCDRNSMAFSREVRLPFLSYKLAEFIASLPIDYLLNDGWTKLILRKSQEKIVPPSIVWRKDKIGYEPPQDLWVKDLNNSINNFKFKKKIEDFTNGKSVSRITDWHWLMIKKFY